MSRGLADLGALMRPAQLVATCVLVLLSSRGRSAAEDTYVPRNPPQRVQAIVDAFRGQLALRPEVRVSVVPVNALLVSVEALGGEADTFRLALDDAFLDRLDDEELHAVVAHELGHVWIFTHHPYLQTERLANEIAMRLVDREHLRRIYSKVWERLGTKGDLARFLGD